MNDFHTADLCDAHPDVQVAEPLFLAYGGRARFSGPIHTVAAPEDNSLVRECLSEPGAGAVLVVDGQGSLRCALVGDQLALLACRNGWAGLVVHGCIRDVGAIAGLDLGVRALGACPRKSEKRGRGARGEGVSFAGVAFRPGEYLYADEDGLVVARTRLA